MDAERLLRASGPHLHFVQSEAARALVDELHRLPCVVAEGSLRAVRTRQQLFDELARVLELPGYFGRNWDALDECLRELAERDGEVARILFLCDAHGFWRDATVLAAELTDCWLWAAAQRAQADGGLHLVYVW